MRISFILILFLSCPWNIVWADSYYNQHDAGFDPQHPPASGYTLVFYDDFHNIKSIDINNTGHPGFKWYLKQFFGHPTTSPQDVEIKDGLLILNPTESEGATIVTAAPANNPQGWVGHAFGGGSYFEATIKFDPATVNTSAGWPAFWSLALEHCINKDQQWPGQPDGYDHFFEDDFFEYDSAWAGTNTYGGAVHDWYGIWKQTCPAFCNVNNSNSANSVIHLPQGINWKIFHTFGQLWVAGNNSNDHHGYVQYYFDGKPTSDRVTWVDPSGPQTPPPSGDSTYSIIDKDHLIIYLGTGKNQPMQVKSVKIWQLSLKPW